MSAIAALFPRSGRKMKQLQQLFRGGKEADTDAVWRKFGDWLNSLFAPGGLLEVKVLDCRHKELRPDGTKPCGVAGTIDAKKGAGIRFTTLLRSAKSYLEKHKGAGPQMTLEQFGGSRQALTEASSVALGIDGAPLPNPETPAVSAERDFTISTKMRVAHLAILQVSFGSARDVEKLKRAYGRLRAEDEMVLHNCGCGLEGCCEPTHLRFGKRGVNDMDKSYHDVIKQPNVEGYSKRDSYFSLIAEIRKKQSGQYVF